MAMLAEPRRKQKVINLRAKNSEWSNDNNKFGQRMLEKMGWSSGKGLGAKENGIVEHVVARYKNDEKGLGFEDKNDQWTKHDDDFNILLANLSNGNEEKVQSGASLEVKSKKSKARIHYHKFTRGKDLSRYSEKDLANIFGKKSFKCEVQVTELPKDEVKITEQVFTEKGSMEDYFKMKLAAFKTKVHTPPMSKKQFSGDEGANYAFHGFSNVADVSEDTHQGFGFQAFSCGTTVNEATDNEKPIDSKIKNSKKKKKLEEQTPVLIINTDKVPSVYKKKKKKHLANDMENCSDLNNTETELPAIVIEKSKTQELVECPPKKKHVKKKITSDEGPKIEVYVTEDTYIPKKKKKRKNKELVN